MNCRTDRQQCRPFWIGGGIVLGLGVAVLVGFIIMWLWNGLMPKLFDLTEITYWQGLGLALLGRLVFGGVGGGGKSNSKKRDRSDHHKNVPFTNKMKDWEHYDKWWEAEGKKSFEEFGKEENAEHE